MQWFPDSNVRGVNMGPPGADSTQVCPHVGPLNLTIWVAITQHFSDISIQ